MYKLMKGDVETQFIAQMFFMVLMFLIILMHVFEKIFILSLDMLSEILDQIADY